MKELGINTNYYVFGTGIVVATLIALFIISGIDLLLWHLLQPVGFWERFVLVVVEVLTFVPRGFFAFFTWIVVAKFAAEIS